MIPATAPLIGFSGEIIWLIGQILLLVKIGDAEHFTSTWMNFVVVRSPSPYNGIIVRPKVRKIQAVPSTAHEMLKFLVPAVEERIKVAIHPDYPEQTITIGSTLTEEGRKALCNLLRRRLNVFAWKPADMTGVPQHTAEHRLNIREGCSPVRQKKRSQALERNKEIQEEVEKLVDVGIMKEVYYHSWLSNSLLVKKHDDSWRMCMDFKDLNKACPKDGYPLPLKNAEATYHRLVDKAFQKQIGRNLEVYVDDLLNGKLASLNRFLSKSAKKSLPFFKTLKKCTKKSDFQWTAEAKVAFKQMKKLITELPILTAPIEREKLIMYLAAAREAYRPRTSVKGQILADFIVECLEDDPLDTPIEEEEELPDPWTLFTDGSSCVDGSGAGLILTNLEGAEFTYALRFSKEPGMIQYLEKVKTLSSSFKKFSIKQVSVEELTKKSINEAEVLAIVKEEGDTWMTTIYNYLTKGTLPAEKEKVWKLEGGLNSLQHENEDELVAVVVKVEIENGLLEEVDKFRWWFEQDIGGENEDDNDKK
ncbi:hypothetical protein Tco_0327667 [Tanacetum coccineum]